MTAAQGSIVILIIVMLLYATEVIPLAVTALGSCAALAVFGLAPSGVVWAGLSSDTTLVVGGMVVVGITLIDTGVAETLGDWILKSTGGRPVLSSTCVILAAMLLSGFMNNSAAVATMMPVMLGVVACSGGRLHEKRCLLPMATATNTGGMLTLIGTTSQMIVQAALLEHGYPIFRFFDFAWVGVPLCLLFVLYQMTAGKWLAGRLWDLNAPHSDMAVSFGAGGTEPRKQRETTRVSEKKQARQLTTVAILAGAVLCMVLDVGVPNGTIAMTAAALCLITKCISIGEVYRKFDWTTVFVLAGGIGFANGLDYCGGGRLIADWLIGMLDGALTPVTVFVMFVVTASVLTQFMSNTAVAAMLTPIAIPFVELLGLNPLALLMGICAATNLSFSTPIATPSMTLVLGPGNYRFVDYVKWCGPFNVVCIVFLLLVIPLVWPLV